MTCFYYIQESHLNVTDTTVCHPVILDFELGAVTQWYFRMASYRQGLGVVCEARRNHRDILVAQVDTVRETANCSQKLLLFLIGHPVFSWVDHCGINSAYPSLLAAGSGHVTKFWVMGCSRSDVDHALKRRGMPSSPLPLPPES